MGALSKALGLLTSQDRAIANARGAATDLSRCRVERREVELFLDELLERRSTSATG
jgi:hypothetical protein